jgi:hypothetical protein
MPGLKVHTLEFPQEHRYTYSEVGPSRFPVYSAEQRKRLRPRGFANVHHDSPETWEHLSWEGMMASQSRVETEIRGWWQKQLDSKELQA